MSSFREQKQNCILSLVKTKPFGIYNIECFFISCWLRINPNFAELNKNLYILSLLILFAQFSLAQQSNEILKEHVIPEVIISSPRLNDFSTGSKIVSIDSSILLNNSTNTLAELLANQSSVFIKSYGISGLASTSFRGFGYSQTAILWNGFNIGSSMNGGQDLNLLPVNFANTVKLQFGGAGALWGSGAIGGSIHLNNKPNFNKGFTLDLTYSKGSFDDHQLNLGFGISKKRYISSLKFLQHQAENNFPFINTAKFGKPIELFQNSQFKQYGFLQENYFNLSDKQIVNLRIWFQSNDRNIPNSISSSIGKAYQFDNALRITSEWQLTQLRATYIGRIASFTEHLDYFDPTLKLISKSKSQSIITEFESKIKINENQFLNIGINNTFNEAQTKNYSLSPIQNRTSVFSSFQIKNQKSTFKSTISARQEFVSNGLNPFTYSLGSELWISKYLKLRGSVSKNYRLPTFNDLYWGQGGNPNLVSESGLSEEFGLAYISCKDKFAIEFENTLFNSNVNNWISWTPDDNGIWSPQNIAQVWSRGLETDLKLYYTIGKIDLNLNTHFQYILTTTEKSNSIETLHKQLMFTPKHKLFSSFNIKYKGYSLLTTLNYVGYRYSNTDNSNFIPSYYTLNIEFNKSFIIKNQSFKSFIQLNNITNSSYQIITFFPSPMRNYQVGISINLNKANKN